MDINTNVNRLRYFQTVCKYGSVTKAATELNIAQPSVTTAIKDLEKELNVILFHRNKNKLVLTEEGMIILKMADRLLNTIDNFFQEVTDISEKAHSKIRLGAPPIMGTRLIPEIFASVTRELPHVSLEIIECGSSQALKYLDENVLDLAVLLEHNLPSDYCHHVFYETEFHFCINNKHPLAKKSYVSCSDLKNIPIAILSHGTSHQIIINQMFQKANVEPNVVLHSVELTTIRRLLENHDIGTITYRDIFKGNPNIVTIPCDTVMEAKLSIAWCRDKYITRAGKDLIKFFKSHQWA
jgi:LysR family cyn operon transcriptional activator